MPIPLDLFAEVTTANGARYKWDANQPPDSRLRNLTFATKIGEGFSAGSGQLARRIDQDYPDLNLVDTVTFTGADGSVAYEGRVEGMPRDLTDRHTIGVTLAGWMAHAKDRKFTEAYVDRDLGSWQDMLLARKTALANSAISTGDFGFTVQDRQVVCALPNQALGAQTLGETDYHAPGDILIAKVQYVGSTVSAPAYQLQIIGLDTAGVVQGESVTPTMDGAVHTATFTTARNHAGIKLYSNAAAVTPTAGALIQFASLAAYGSHGLTLRAGESGQPDGVYASDVIKDLAGRYCPQLNVSGVQDTSYVIQHLAFRDQTFPYDAFLEINKYHLWQLAVWENKQLVYQPYDFSDYDWEIRTDDQGVTFSPQGVESAAVFSGMVVTYTDLLSGLVNVLTPVTNPTELSNSDSSNPWNAHGIPHWDDITLSKPSTQTQALELGRAALADRNTPKTPGTLTVQRYIRDRAGNLQPVWKVRAGDTISITNFPNDSPRLIVETDYDDESKQIRISVDRPFALLDAYLDRVGNALSAAGLG